MTDLLVCLAASAVFIAALRIIWTGTDVNIIETDRDDHGDTCRACGRQILDKWNPS